MPGGQTDTGLAVETLTIDDQPAGSRPVFPNLSRIDGSGNVVTGYRQTPVTEALVAAPTANRNIGSKGQVA